MSILIEDELKMSIVLVYIHCREFDIFNSHDLLPSDLVAQSVEQRRSNPKVVGSIPTRVGIEPTLVVSLLGQLFIFGTIFQPWALSSDIPAAERGLFTKYHREIQKKKDISHSFIFTPCISTLPRHHSLVELLSFQR